MQAWNRPTACDQLKPQKLHPLPKHTHTGTYTHTHMGMGSRQVLFVGQRHCRKRTSTLAQNHTAFLSKGRGRRKRTRTGCQLGRTAAHDWHFVCMERTIRKRQGTYMSLCFAFPGQKKTETAYECSAIDQKTRLLCLPCHHPPSLSNSGRLPFRPCNPLH